MYKLQNMMTKVLEKARQILPNLSEDNAMHRTAEKYDAASSGTNYLTNIDDEYFSAFHQAKRKSTKNPRGITIKIASKNPWTTKVPLPRKSESLRIISSSHPGNKKAWALYRGYFPPFLQESLVLTTQFCTLLRILRLCALRPSALVVVTQFNMF